MLAIQSFPKNKNKCIFMYIDILMNLKFAKLDKF